MPCGVYGKYGHNGVTCPQDGERVSLHHGGPRSRRCECCGQYGYATQRHHTRGRGDDSDYLDLCTDCHLQCTVTTAIPRTFRSNRASVGSLIGRVGGCATDFIYRVGMLFP